MIPVLGQLPQMLVVLEGTIIDNVPVSKRQMIRCSSGGKQEPVVRVLLPLIVADTFLCRIQFNDFAVEMKFGALFRFAPDLFHRAPLPQSLREIRTHVGWIRLHAKHANGPLFIKFTDSLRRGIPCQSATDDQVLIMFHLCLLRSNVIARSVRSARNDESNIPDAINNNTLPTGIALPCCHGSANDTPGMGLRFMNDETKPSSHRGE